MKKPLISLASIGLLVSMVVLPTMALAQMAPGYGANAALHPYTSALGPRASGGDHWPDGPQAHFQEPADYDAMPEIGKIQATLLAINSADDQVNPPELGILEREIKRVKRGRFILIPTSDKTRGHGTHSMPTIWGEHLARLLKESAH